MQGDEAAQRNYGSDNGDQCADRKAQQGAATDSDTVGNHISEIHGATRREMLARLHEDSQKEHGEPRHLALGPRHVAPCRADLVPGPPRCSPSPMLRSLLSPEKNFGPIFSRLAPYRVKPVEQNPAILDQRRSTSMFSILSLMYLALALSMPGPAPTPAGATSTSVTNCYCQTMPMKDWGK